MQDGCRKVGIMQRIPIRRGEGVKRDRTRPIGGESAELGDRPEPEGLGDGRRGIAGNGVEAAELVRGLFD
jgi:hypothetical protein